VAKDLLGSSQNAHFQIKICNFAKSLIVAGLGAGAVTGTLSRKDAHVR
jgi:hypothetical protein